MFRAYIRPQNDLCNAISEFWQKSELCFFFLLPYTTGEHEHIQANFSEDILQLFHFI